MFNLEEGVYSLKILIERKGLKEERKKENIEHHWSNEDI
jgi:hypothetical protein